MRYGVLQQRHAIGNAIKRITLTTPRSNTDPDLVTNAYVYVYERNRFCPTFATVDQAGKTRFIPFPNPLRRPPSSISTNIARLLPASATSAAAEVTTAAAATADG